MIGLRAKNPLDGEYADYKVEVIRKKMAKTIYVQSIGEYSDKLTKMIILYLKKNLRKCCDLGDIMLVPEYNWRDQTFICNEKSEEIYFITRSISHRA